MKQKESSKNINDDAAMSTSKDEENVEGDLARASVEKENSSLPPATMILAGPLPTNPPHPFILAQGMSFWSLSSKVSHRLLPLPSLISSATPALLIPLLARMRKM